MALLSTAVAALFHALPILRFAAPTQRLAVLHRYSAELNCADASQRGSRPCRCLAVSYCSTASRCESCLCRCWAFLCSSSLSYAIAMPIRAMPLPVPLIAQLCQCYAPRYCSMPMRSRATQCRYTAMQSLNFSKIIQLLSRRSAPCWSSATARARYTCHNPAKP